MRWTILIVNVLAALALQILASLTETAQQNHASSVYRELLNSHAIVEQPIHTNAQPVDVGERLRSIAASGHSSTLTNIGSVVCVFSGVIFFFYHRSRSRENIT